MFSQFRFVGQPVARIDSRRKVSGQQRFMNDIAFPGALWAVVVRSPHARADVQTYRTEPAQAYPGVVAILTADDVPKTKFNPAASPPNAQLEAAADRHLLTRQAQHVGDGVAVVVAASREAAFGGARALQIEWDVKEPILDANEAFEKGQILGRMALGDETADEILAVADLVVEGTYQTPPVQHICLEPHACAAVPEPLHDRITLWSNTQSPSDIRRLCADILDIPLKQIHVRKVNEGGGFGCKQELYEEALVVWLALQLGRPVRLSYTRREEFTASRGRHGTDIHIRLGFQAEGRLLVCDVQTLLDSGGYASHAPYVLGNISSTIIYTYPHAVHRFEGYAVRTNTLPGGAYRGFGAAQPIFALEQSMDMAALKLGIDPVTLRRRNAANSDRPDPYFGRQADGRLQACLDAGTKAFGWTGRAATTGEDGRLRADGMAVTALVSVTATDLPEGTSATVYWNEDGTVTLLTGTCDCGTGSSTVLAQIVAEVLDVPLKAVEVREGDTDSGLVDLGSFAQRSVYIGGGAAQKAAVAAREQLLDVVALKVGCPRKGLTLSSGSIVHEDDENFSIPLRDFCRQFVAHGNIVITETYRPDRNPPSYGACFVTVAVDPDTGLVEVEHCVSVADCGCVLNPLGAAGQTHGGVVQGLGFATIERWEPHNNGTGPRSILEHGIPYATDVPSIQAVFINAPASAGPYGGKGLGEVPVPPVAAAVANAIARATGTRMYGLPLRPDEVWHNLQETYTAERKHIDESATYSPT